MRLVSALALLGLLGSGGKAADRITVPDLDQQLHHLSIDPDQSYHVRNLRLRRGNVSIYLEEGIVAFAHPVAGHFTAAVFTTVSTETGDGEILLMPEQPSERASLASFTGSPNLDEHFDDAILFFSDNTAGEITSALSAAAPAKVPDAARQLQPQLDPILQQQAQNVRSVLLATLLDDHQPSDGLFMATIVGRKLGIFHFLYYPKAFEPVTIEGPAQDGHANSQIWTAFRPRRAPPYSPPTDRISDYHLETSIADDLTVSTIARFRYTPGSAAGRVISLGLSPRLRVATATVNGEAAEVVQSQSDLQAPQDVGLSADAPLLLVTPQPLVPKQDYQLEIHYAGQVIQHRSGNSYLVGERTIWYPHLSPMSATFDLIFKYPSRFQLVATGEELSTTKTADKFVLQHLRTAVPEQLVGFNLGQYSSLTLDSAHYRVNCYAEASASTGMNEIPKKAAEILDFYTDSWQPLPIHTLSVTPVPGYFGQGFPGLIYLSNLSYVRDQDRPARLQGARAQTFFSDLLLPHEIAHQWWGNLVGAANYRSAWLNEAMATYSALQFLSRQQSDPITVGVLAHFREDLLRVDTGKPIDSYGPVDFGERLLQNAGQDVWHTITYEKGAWILHMLRQRLGAQGFLAMQKQVLHDYTGQAITNDQFREAAARLLPADQPDRTLTKFFETWVYSTGIPKLQMTHTRDGASVLVSEVDDEFTTDIPLHCKGAGKRARTKWLSVVSGDNPIHEEARETCELPSESDFLYYR